MKKSARIKFNASEYGIRLKNWGRVEEIRIKKILSLIGKNKNVLDIGCDDGELSERILKNGNKLLGVDISSPALIKAKKRGVSIVKADFESSLPSNLAKKFDLVFAGEVIEHIYDTDRFLQNIRNVLIGHGELVITTPNLASLGRRLLLLFGKNPLIEVGISKSNAGHIRYFTYDSLKNLLEKNGFSVVFFTSTLINFDINGKYFSKKLADLFPKFGSTLIFKAIKK